jgi:integrase/recombinase XerD
MTLVEAQALFLEWLATRGYAQGTIHSRRRHMMTFVAFLKSRWVQSVDEVTRGMVEEYGAWVMGRRHWHTSQKLSIRTVVGYFHTIKVFFRFMIQRNVLVMDPSGWLAWPKVKRPLPKNIPTEEEMEQILFRPDIGTLSGMRDRAILELIYSTGLRRGEVANLDIYDVNLLERTVTVRRGKGGKGRVLPVGQIALEFLIRYINEARPKMVSSVKRAAEGPQAPALFVVDGGMRLSPDRLGQRVSRYVRSVKPTVTLGCHAIRHAFATHLLRGGADIGMIQRLLGHTSIATTEIYTHVAPVDLKIEHAKCHPRGRLTTGNQDEGRCHEDP